MTANVRVIAVTKPVIKEIGSSDDIIAYTARVSNPSNQANTETAPKLLKYLKKHAHWSPFEMAHCVMEIETTRDIARQILRHRSFAFQEFSQRYANPEDLGDMFTRREARLQDTKNRQNSIEVHDEEMQKQWELLQDLVITYVDDAYKWALDVGIAKEQARAVLPEGLTKSRLYMSGSVRSWVHYCELRKGNGTQKEHQKIAELCWKELLTQFPSLHEEEKR